MIRIIFKKPVDKGVVDSSLKELGIKLDVYDQILSKQKYIAGNVSPFFTIVVNLGPFWNKPLLFWCQEITLADFYHIPYGTVLGEDAGCNIIETRPNVAKYIIFFFPGDISAETVIRRWFKEISSRPSWQAVKKEIKSEKTSKF